MDPQDQDGSAAANDLRPNAELSAESDTEEAYRLEDQVGFLLRLVTQRHLAIFKDRMPVKITAQQFAVMVRLKDLEESSQNELGRQVGMDQSTMNGVVQRLLKREYLTSSLSGTDQRRVLLRLTAKGRELLETLMPAAQEITRATLTPLTKAEQKKLLTLLAKMS